MSLQPEAVLDAPRGPGMSPWQRIVRIFTSPSRAWEGLEDRVQFWIPLVFVVVLQAALSAATYHRVLVPMMLEQWDDAVVNGQMQQAQVDKMSEFFANNPMAIALTVGQQVVILPLITLLVAAVVWFGCGFVLGTKFRYRLALETVSWASLIQVPATILTFTIAWFTESFKGVHLGFAALLPEAETPNKLHSGLTVFLDAIGPFGIWYVFVLILGASALSGAPRKNVAWVLIALYLALSGLFAAVAASFTPGA